MERVFHVVFFFFHEVFRILCSAVVTMLDSQTRGPRLDSWQGGKNVGDFTLQATLLPTQQ